MEQPDPAIRFLRFEYDGYYPGGFDGDCRGKFATLAEALAEPSNSECRFVYDAWTGEEHEIAMMPPEPRKPAPAGSVEELVEGTLPWILNKRRVEAQQSMLALFEDRMFASPAAFARDTPRYWP